MSETILSLKREIRLLNEDIDSARENYETFRKVALDLTVENERLQEVNYHMYNALQGCLRLINEALPKFNWGASCLDANAIKLLNEVPLTVRAAIQKAEGIK